MTCGTCKYETASDFPCSGCTHGRWWEPKDDEQQVQAESISPEPVAWMYKSEPWFDGNRWHDKYDVTTDERVARFKDKNPQPLYTTPPERKPLTEEVETLHRDAMRYRFIRDADRSDCITPELSLYAMETLDEYVDAAMDGERTLKGEQE